MQKVEEELNKKKLLLATLEEDQKNAEVEKCKLLIETHEKNVQQSTATKEADIKKKLDTTQQELLKANANIKSVTQSIKNAKATMEKVKWQQDQKIVEQQKVENDLDLVLEDMQQISDAVTPVATLAVFVGGVLGRDPSRAYIKLQAASQPMIDLVSRNSSKPSTPHSRPLPDFL